VRRNTVKTQSSGAKHIQSAEKVFRIEQKMLGILLLFVFLSAFFVRKQVRSLHLTNASYRNAVKQLPGEQSQKSRRRNLLFTSQKQEIVGTFDNDRQEISSSFCANRTILFLYFAGDCVRDSAEPPRPRAIVYSLISQSP
jgi:hypothetical protein